jgi:chemotaxis protein MotB
VGKKHKHPEHENLERWLVSYADFITLLFATFVVLYALSQADLAKFKELSVALKQAFNPAKSVMENPGGVMKGTPDAHILKDSGNSILDKVMPKMPDNAQQEGSIQPIADVVQKANQEINRLNIKNGMTHQESVGQTQLKIQERGIVISFSSSLFFSPGSAGLKPDSFDVLNKVAESLVKSGRIVHVEGHTDNQPINSAVYPSNWELSASRASSVVRYFVQKHHFDPTKLAAVGYGDTRPVANNSTPQGRSQNRRVDLVILFSSATKEADAGAAQSNEKLLRSNESDGIGGEDVDLKKRPAPSEEAVNKSVSQPINIRPNVLDGKPFKQRPEDIDSAKKLKPFRESESSPPDPNKTVADKEPASTEHTN